MLALLPALHLAFACTCARYHKIYSLIPSFKHLRCRMLFEFVILLYCYSLVIIQSIQYQYTSLGITRGFLEDSLGIEDFLRMESASIMSYLSYMCRSDQMRTDQTIKLLVSNADLLVTFNQLRILCKCSIYIARYIASCQWSLVGCHSDQPVHEDQTLAAACCWAVFEVCNTCRFHIVSWHAAAQPHIFYESLLCEKVHVKLVSSISRHAAMPSTQPPSMRGPLQLCHCHL